MFLKFFTWSLVVSMLMWYFHEYHTVQFMMLFRNIPYLSPFIAQLHSSSGHKELDQVAGEKLYTIEELLSYDGSRGTEEIYISILGKVSI